MTKEEFKNLILKEKEEPENRGGMTPLAALANDLSLKTSKEKEDVERLLSQLTTYFDKEFSPNDIITLSGFIQSAKFREPEFIFKSYINWLKTSKKQTDNHEKRAEILVLLSNLGYPFTKLELLKEEDIKNNFFWLWVKAMRNIGNLDDIISEIPNQVNKHGQFKSLLAILPALLREFHKEENKLASIAKTWYERLQNVVDKQILKDWFAKKEIYFDAILSEEEKSFFAGVHKWQKVA